MDKQEKQEGKQETAQKEKKEGQKRKEDKEKKDSKKRINKASLILTSVFIILTFIVIVFVISSSPERKEFLECDRDSDCVKLQTTCCPCEMGGIEKCVPHGQEALFMPKDCSKNPVCIALYNCEVKSCICVEGSCAEVVGEKTEK